jgi:hypothetical protein
MNKSKQKGTGSKPRDPLAPVFRLTFDTTEEAEAMAGIVTVILQLLGRLPQGKRVRVKANTSNIVTKYSLVVPRKARAKKAPGGKATAENGEG